MATSAPRAVDFKPSVRAARSATRGAPFKVPPCGRRSPVPPPREQSPVETLRKGAAERSGRARQQRRQRPGERKAMRRARYGRRSQSAACRADRDAREGSRGAERGRAHQHGPTQSAEVAQRRLHSRADGAAPASHPPATRAALLVHVDRLAAVSRCLAETIEPALAARARGAALSHRRTAIRRQELPPRSRQVGLAGVAKSDLRRGQVRPEARASRT